MRSNKEWLFILALVVVRAGMAAAQPVAVAIDTTHTEPITNLMFGGFMEPATTQVWAEMLSERKFFNEQLKTATRRAGGRVWPKGTATPVGAFRRRRICRDGQQERLRELVSAYDWRRYRRILPRGHHASALF
jgi:hypothetical protein